MKNIIMGFICIVLSASAFADDPVTGPGRSDYVDIAENRIQLIQGGMSRLYIYDVDMRAHGETDCTVKTTPVLIFNSGDITQEIYSALLMAKASGKKVDLIAGNCVEISGETYSSISSIYVK